MTSSNKGYKESKRQFHQIAAIACQWLCDLRLDNPQAKNVLQALVLHADAEGICFPSLGRLAQITELHIDTVRRRLCFLEECRLIRRTPQWVDTNGIRNGEGRGKQTSDKIRLLFAADVCEQHSTGSKAVRAPTELAGNDAHQDKTIEAVSPRAALAQPWHSGEGIILEQEQEREESPPTPPSGGLQNDLSWKAFERAWAEPIAKLSLVQDIWTTLAPADRTTAVKAAAGYWAWRKSEKRPPRAISARNFLRERGGWAQWLSYSPGISRAEQLAVEVEGSPAWRARCTIAKIAGKALPVAIELSQGRGNRLPPLPAEYIVLERYADDDPAAWEFLDQTDVRCRAWCNFLRLEAKPMKFGTKAYEHNGHHYNDWPIKRTGLRVPCSWPPGYGNASDVVPL